MPAKTKRVLRRRKKEVRRPKGGCLKCGEDFKMKSVNRRICDPCKKSYEWQCVTIHSITLPNKKTRIEKK